MVFSERSETPGNEFNLDLWGDEYFEAINEMRLIWEKSSYFIIEITSPRTARWDGLCVNTNPNIDRRPHTTIFGN